MNCQEQIFIKMLNFNASNFKFRFIKKLPVVVYATCKGSKQL